MTVKLTIAWLPRPSAKYRGCYPLGFENHIEEILGTNNIIHFFSGLAKSGFRIDINPDVEPDLIANVENLPQIKSNSYRAGLADPPYDEKFAKELYNCEYPQWSKWTKELVRIVKIGGLIAIMQNYIVPCPKNCEFVEVKTYLRRIKQFPQILTIFRKIK